MLLLIMNQVVRSNPADVSVCALCICNVLVCEPQRSLAQFATEHCSLTATKVPVAGMDAGTRGAEGAAEPLETKL